MKHVLKILKKSIVPIIFIMAILVLQALLDLSLPTYTSDIVNNGIVNYGITNSYPDVIRESEYNKLTKYLTNEEKDIENKNIKKLVRKKENDNKKDK